MMTLCKLFNVPAKHYDQSRLPESMREVDFYLIGNTYKELHRCEVKLMGKGNPESADAVIARNSKVFIADKLSDLNKRQLTKLGIEWVELRNSDALKRFTTALKNLRIPFKEFAGNIDERLPQIFKEVFR
ncbi:MAG: CfrBI family restriction endonuclease [Bacteroidota bacterium]|nr:CfrBI family restriction endonuclease [Bacteroidota bacterium]